MRYRSEGRRVAVFKNYLSSHNNFLISPAIMIENQKGNDLTFKVPKFYSSFTLYLLSDSNAVVKRFSKNDS